MSGEVISVLSLVGRYYNCPPSQSCDNLFITYLCLYQASNREITRNAFRTFRTRFSFQLHVINRTTKLVSTANDTNINFIPRFIFFSAFYPLFPRFILFLRFIVFPLPEFRICVYPNPSMSHCYSYRLSHEW